MTTPLTTPTDTGATLLQDVLATLRDNHGFEKARVDTYAGPGGVEIRHHFAGGVFTLTSRVREGRHLVRGADNKPKGNTVTWDGRKDLPTVQDIVRDLFV